SRRGRPRTRLRGRALQPGQLHHPLRADARAAGPGLRLGGDGAVELRHPARRDDLVVDPAVGPLEAAVEAGRGFPVEPFEDHRVVAVAATDALGGAEVVPTA